MARRMNALEILGRLSRARETVKIAQRAIGQAEQLVLERDVGGWRMAPTPHPIREALVRAKQAVADLETLVENTKTE